MSDIPRIFIGYDQQIALPWSVFSYSIQRRASGPVYVAPVMLDQLKDVFYRDRDPKQSNDFSFSRWIVPYLCNYEGWAVFADNDMICLDDIYKLWNLRDDKYAVMCVKHDYEVKEEKKFLNRIQTKYEKKNWSSMMLINCSKCKALTPEYVNSASGLELHQFKWLNDDSLIGELPKEWNHLVGCLPPNKEAKIVHYTIGGPYFKEYDGCEYSDEWHREYALMTNCDQLAFNVLPNQQER